MFRENHFFRIDIPCPSSVPLFHSLISLPFICHPNVNALPLPFSLSSSLNQFRARFYVIFAFSPTILSSVSATKYTSTGCHWTLRNFDEFIKHFSSDISTGFILISIYKSTKSVNGKICERKYLWLPNSLRWCCEVMIFQRNISLWPWSLQQKLTQ